MSDTANLAAKTRAAIETWMLEHREFPPPPEFAAQANVNDPAVYERAATDLEGYWAEEASRLDWYRPWDTDRKSVV